MNQKCFPSLANYRVPGISSDICNLDNAELLSLPCELSRSPSEGTCCVAVWAKKAHSALALSLGENLLRGREGENVGSSQRGLGRDLSSQGNTCGCGQHIKVDTLQEGGQKAGQ